MTQMGRARFAVLAVLFVALALLQSWATFRFFTSRYPGGNDFYARWANGCALVWSGENPYSEAATLQTQIGMYGRPARLGEDLAAFSYPLYALFAFWPLCFIDSYPLVQAIWMTLMMYALLVGIVVAARVVEWRPPRWLWGLTLVWGVLNYPHARALILGQMATLVFLVTAAALLFIKCGRDWAAGAVVAVATIKPQMSFLLIPWILWWSAWQSRWRVWKGFGLAMGLLVGGSFLLVPTWLSEFLLGIRRYDVVSGTDYHSLTWIIACHFLDLSPVVKGIGVGAFSLLAAWTMWKGRRADWSGFLWSTGLILILTNFIAPRTATTHYSMLVLPLFGWFSCVAERWKPRGTVLLVAVEASLLVGQWGLFLASVDGSYETALVYLPFPISLLALHVASRPGEASMLTRWTDAISTSFGGWSRG